MMRPGEVQVVPAARQLPAGVAVGFPLSGGVGGWRNPKTGVRRRGDWLDAARRGRLGVMCDARH